MTEDAFYAQKGISALQKMSTSEFEEIFASQIQKGEISEGWMNRFQSLFAKPPTLQEGLAKEIAEKKAKKNPILSEEFQKLDLKS